MFQNIKQCSPEVQLFYSQGINLRTEIDQEDSLSPAAIRMTKRIFRNLKYNFSVSSSEKTIELPPPSISLTNSMIYEVGDECCLNAFNDFMSKYSSTIVSILPLNKVEPVDIPADLLQVKSNITK